MREYLKKLGKEIKYCQEKINKEKVEWKKKAFERMKMNLLVKKSLLEQKYGKEK